MTYDEIYAEVVEIYRASNAASTKSLYLLLRECGAEGLLAIELLRASKSSERAKVYRGSAGARGSYRSLAYERKQTAMNDLCRMLSTACLFGWGWGIYDAQPVHRHVLYADLPTGQVSFHTGDGPDYGKSWDGMPGQSAPRICAWAAQLLVPVMARLDNKEAVRP